MATGWETLARIETERLAEARQQLHRAAQTRSWTTRGMPAPNSWSSRPTHGGGQDNVQAVAGQLLAFFSELGFLFPQFPFVAHSRGWSAEDMERNVAYVQGSATLHDGARALVRRAVETSRLLLTGRKGCPAAMPEPPATAAQAAEAGRA